MTMTITNVRGRQVRVVLPPGIIAQGATGQMGGMGGGGMGGGGMGGHGRWHGRWHGWHGRWHGRWLAWVAAWAAWAAWVVSPAQCPPPWA